MDTLVLFVLLALNLILGGYNLFRWASRSNKVGKNKTLEIRPHMECTLVDTDTLFKISNRTRLIRISDSDRLKVVTREVKSGVTSSPLVVVVDNSGKVALKDGHHRLLAAKTCGYRYLPVIFKPSRRISSHGVHIKEVLPGLIGEPEGD